MFASLLLLTLLAPLAVAQEPADPPELQQLRGAYQQRAMRAMQPVNDRFLRQLQDLLRRYHAAGRLGDAVASTRSAPARREDTTLDSSFRVGLFCLE